MDAMMETIELHSIRSAARRCQVAPGTVRNWMLTGTLAYRRSNNRIYIREDELDTAHALRVEIRNAQKRAVRS